MCNEDLLTATFALILTTLCYDELGLASHYIGKNLCNIGGYTSFEVGATKLMGASCHLDAISMSAICISGALIFTTIQAQDFADVEGDKRLGRITLPIYAPRASRLMTLFAMVAWSLFLGWFWDIGVGSRISLVTLGMSVGARYSDWRISVSDRKSYALYNVRVSPSRSVNAL